MDTRTRAPPARSSDDGHLLAALGVVSGCVKEEPKAPPPRPPVDVTVMTVAERDTPVSFEFVGQTQSSREVEIRARVEGFLDKRLYVEGDLVRSGQPLFQIDTKPFNATLQSSKGGCRRRRKATGAGHRLSLVVPDPHSTNPDSAGVPVHNPE